MAAPATFRLWDTERSMSIPVEDVRLADEMVYVVSLAAEMDAPLSSYRQRILSEDYALLELDDGTTTLVELMEDGPVPQASQPAPLMTVQYLIVG